MRKTQTCGIGCIYVAKIDFVENLVKQILYIVLSSNPLTPFNLVFFFFFFVIKGIGLQFTLFTLLKKRKLKYIFIIFCLLVQFLRSYYETKFIFLPRFSLSFGSSTTNPKEPEPHIMRDVVNLVAK